jgi:2'-5' RNA ligase
MRAFIAIDFEKEIKNNISSLIRNWDTGEKNIRWVKTQGMHLTLKFLGEVSEDHITKVKSVLSNIAQDYPSFRLNLKGTGRFPHGGRHPRVIWIGIEMNEILQNIHARLENELQKIHFPKENRKFHPHLTLGRVKSPHNLGLILEKLEQNKENDFGDMTVNKIILFKSTLKPGGAEYTNLAEFYLK